MVPASILMRRWFRSHCGLAIGVCAAGTGLATVAFSPLFTSIAEKSGVDHAFLWTAVFCLAAAAAVFCLVRDDPHALGLEPFGKEAQESAQTQALHALHPTRLRWAMVQLAVLLVSGIGATGFTHLMTLYMAEGMDAMRAAAAFSLCGLALMAGKFACGALCDRLGSYRSNYLLFGCFYSGLRAVYARAAAQRGADDGLGGISGVRVVAQYGRHFDLGGGSEHAGAV